MFNNIFILFEYILPNQRKITIFAQTKYLNIMGGIGSGGARKNAGRKSMDGEPRVKISVTLPAWQLDLVRHEADRRQLPTSHLIAELITKGLEQ